MDVIKIHKDGYSVLTKRLDNYRRALEQVIEICGELESANQLNRIYEIAKKASDPTIN